MVDEEKAQYKTSPNSLSESAISTPIPPKLKLNYRRNDVSHI